MLDALTPLLVKIGGPRRALALLVGGAAGAWLIGLSRWASEPTWVAAFTGVPIETVGQLTDKLQRAGVTYRLARGGADVEVAATDIAKARVALARDGGMPSAGRPGLELFDQPSWGMTDFTQRINYRRALEGELERTIGKIRGIESAQVHLVLHEGDSFGAPTRPTEASVVLKGPGEIGADVVKGISHLVASSVDGLSAERVTIVDDAGRLLSEAEDINSISGLTSHQLTMQRETEEYLRTKAERIVAEIVGAPNMRIQLSAAMSFDQVQRKVDTVDPDKQAVVAETKGEVTAAQGGGGQNNTTTTYENSRSTETFAAAPGTVKRLTVAVLVADRVTSPANGTTKPAVTQPRSADELRQIETLVRSAVGADSARGDQVSVVSVPFAPTVVAPAEPVTRDIGTAVQDYQRPVFGLLAVLAIIGVAFMSLKMVSAQAVANPVMALPRGANGAIMLPSMPAAPAQVGMGMRDRVAGTIEQQPDVAARVVRAWIKES